MAATRVIKGKIIKIKYKLYIYISTNILEWCVFTFAIFKAVFLCENNV